MSSIVGSLFGGGGGLDYKAQSANLINPVTQVQADEQYGNVQNAIQNQQNLLAALNAQNGIANQSNVFNQLSGVAAGTGPNPAQAQLANATGQNVANQAALMAGQRGMAANPALAARQAGMIGANAQQQAAGQGAALQAQQSLNALGQMGNMAGQQVAQQQGATNALTGAAQNAYGQILGGANQQNQANLQNTQMQNNINAQMAQQRGAMQGNLLGNIMGGVGTAIAGPLGGMIGGGLSSLFGSKDNTYGATPGQNDGFGLAQGGVVPSAGPSSHVGQYLHKMAKGGQVPVMLSPGEKVLQPHQVNSSNPIAEAKTVPGKAKVKGDSAKNDTVKTSLPEGSVVIPRSVLQSKNPKKSAAEFVEAVLARKKHSK